MTRRDDQDVRYWPTRKARMLLHPEVCSLCPNEAEPGHALCADHEQVDRSMRAASRVLR